ncbi:hypothetical protein [Methanobrevibacter sp. YE315]|nr:hypothetical protein [Methanobrevibacter sp. YE315]
MSDNEDINHFIISKMWNMFHYGSRKNTTTSTPPFILRKLDNKIVIITNF